MKRTIYPALVALALLALAGCGAADETTEAPTRDVLAEGLTAAKAAGLPLLVDVYADW